MRLRANGSCIRAIGHIGHGRYEILAGWNFQPVVRVLDPMLNNTEKR